MNLHEPHALCQRDYAMQQIAILLNVGERRKDKEHLLWTVPRSKTGKECWQHRQHLCDRSAHIYRSKFCLLAFAFSHNRRRFERYRIHLSHRSRGRPVLRLCMQCIGGFCHETNYSPFAGFSDLASCKTFIPILVERA